jgi:hypothetical protein
MDTPEGRQGRPPELANLYSESRLDTTIDLSTESAIRAALVQEPNHIL